VAIGGALVLAGVLLVTLRLDRASRRPAGPLPSGAHASVAGMVGFVVPAVLFLPVVFLVLVSEHLVPAAALGSWLVHAVAIAGVDRAIGPAWSSPRRSWLVGLAAGALGSGAAWAVLLAGPTARNWAPALVDAVVVALVVLAARAGRVLSAVAAIAATGLTCVAVLNPGVLLPRPAPVTAAPSTPPTPTTPLPTTVAPAPAPDTTTPPPPTVEADAACDQADLDFVVTGWDAAMGARFASVQATNTGDAACWVQGVPSVTLLQRGRPLELTLEPGQMGDGSPVVARQVGIAPGGHAYALLDWRTCAGWADDTTPQAVTVALTTGTAPVPAGIVGGHGPAPFDLADGGAWGVGPWAPPGN
jgi:hypothetical protein